MLLYVAHIMLISLVHEGEHRQDTLLIYNQPKSIIMSLELYCSFPQY